MSEPLRDRRDWHPVAEQHRRDIRLLVYPGSDELHSSIEDAFTSAHDVELANGVPARLTSMDHGLGPVRVEWVHDGTSFTLLSARLLTDAGLSGPTIDELVRMAGSV